MTLESQNLLFPRVCCGSLVLLLWAVSVLEISLRYKLKVLLCLFLEKEMAAHSSVLVWRIPGMAEPVGCCPWGCTEPDTTEATSLPLFTFMYWRRKWQPTQCSCLENPRDRGAWWPAICGVTQSWTRLSDFTFTFHFTALEKEMAGHSSVLAWRIPGTEEPGGLPSMGSYRVGHD